MPAFSATVCLLLEKKKKKRERERKGHLEDLNFVLLCHIKKRFCLLFVCLVLYHFVTISISTGGRHYLVITTLHTPKSSTMALCYYYPFLFFFLHFFGGSSPRSRGFWGECSTIHSPPALFLVFSLNWRLAREH